MKELPDELFDEDGYPTEEVLDWIEHYDDYKNLGHLFDVCFNHLWSYPNFVTYNVEDGQERAARLGGYTDTKVLTHTWDVATGGWSGNESILQYLQSNYVVWSITWQLSERGGRYVFEWEQVCDK